MKMLTLAAVFLLCLLGVSHHAQVRSDAGCNCPETQRQRVALARVPPIAWGAYKAWNSPQGRAARIAIQQERAMMRRAQIEAQRRNESDRAELAWKINNGYARRAAAPGGTPTRTEWLYNGVNVGDKADRWDRSGSSMFDNTPERSVRRDLTAPSSDRSFLDSKPSGGDVRGFSKEKRGTRDTFTPARSGRDD